MRLLRLRVENLRILEAVDLELASGINLVGGANGSGKTSLLEAVYLLAYGRSFRGGARTALIRRGSQALLSFAEVGDETDGMRRRVGLRRTPDTVEAQIDGRAVGALTDLFFCVPFVCFEPDSGQLIQGGAELRRRFVDWGLFHVERDFLATWRRYQRALKQRNILLRQQATDPAQYEVWEQQLATSGEQLSQWRRAYLQGLEPSARASARMLLPEAGELTLRYRAGWAADRSLRDALREGRERDLRQGHTSSGPHRADWELGFAEIPGRDAYSRGQAKLAALSLLLAQIREFRSVRGQAPIVGLDDVAAELDPAHQQAVLVELRDLDAQILMTRTQTDGFAPGPNDAVFHVEQGKVTRLL